ncbi:MAG: hypothetical protein OEL76_05065 [Siculibacillus sp.]|nr:hypothetical protein [Siculibacillus sp.]
MRTALGTAMIVAVIATTTATTAWAAETAADRFVGDLVATCALSTTVKQVRANLSNRFVPENKTAATDIPKALKPFLGEPTAEKKDGYVAVRVPIKATVKGLKVLRVNFTIGVENGIDAQVVTFAAPLDAVEQKLGDGVRKIRAKGAEGLEVLLEPEGDTTDYVCDHSM